MTPYSAKANPRFSGGKVSARIACVIGCKPATEGALQHPEKKQYSEARRETTQNELAVKKAMHVEKETLPSEPANKEAADRKHDGV